MSAKVPIQDHAFETMPDAESLEIEDRLWWLRGRKLIITEYLRRITRLRAISWIMDIGCGSGGNLDALGKVARVIGVERSATLARRSRERAVAEVIFEQDALELDECRDVQLFTMFDVLEHIEGDGAFLARLRKKGAQGHLLLLSVPACPFLYGDHDRILHHYRRYTDESLRATLEQAGYRVLQTSYFMFFLFPLVLLARLRDRVATRLGKSRAIVELGDLPRLLSVPLTGTLKLEALLSRKIRFPIGLWLFAVAEANHGSPAGSA